ncbi:hypothetical protein H2200_012494 [Cladophialophora chaetospira]|uniref:Uncharacterized protein n=1 Tax=Cladophialophora chaetospira TaxID=386627 RepID=A0AA39CCG3_9EURO|nr:hypothetical protein H2200_012494 [Cladophialophora chaetospira]
MVINKPPTSRRLHPDAQPLVVNGVVSPQIYVQRLTDITSKFYSLDDSGATGGGNDQAYATALELDRELRVLSSQTTRSWWNQDTTQLKPESMCQLLHYYFMMRVHLPFTMRQNSADGNAYSRLTCMEACEEVAQRYQALRRLLPSGIFLSPMLDLQAFTATVVLLLSSHSGPASDRADVQANKLRVQDIAAQVLKVMDERSRDGAGANWARQGAVTIRALHGLLRGGGETIHAGNLSLKVPILGNINVRRNTGHSEMAKTQQPMQNLPGVGLWKPDAELNSQQMDVASLSQSQLAPLNMQEQTPWQWNPLSWSIEENNDNVFQDAFMADNFDQFGTWGGGYNNFQFIN